SSGRPPASPASGVGFVVSTASSDWPTRHDAQSHTASRTTAKNHCERDPIMSTHLLSRAGQGVVGSLWYMGVAPSTPARIIGEEPAICLGSSAIARTMSPSRPWSVHVPLASVHL